MSASACCDGPFDNHILYKALYLKTPPSESSVLCKKLLNFSDSVISLFLVGPFVITYWRGTWSLMDLYRDNFPGMNCFIIGVIIHCCFCVLRVFLHTEYIFLRNFSKASSLMFILRTLYVYIFSIGCIMHW
jgi:hypothetical protein